VQFITAQSGCSHRWTSHTVSCSCQHTWQLFLVLQIYSITERSMVARVMAAT